MEPDTTNCREYNRVSDFTFSQEEPVSEMTYYTVSRGILNSSIPYHTISQEDVPQHTSQYVKFQGILEFVSRQLIALSTIFSEPTTQRKTT